MTSSPDADPLSAARLSESEVTLKLSKRTISPTASIASLPYRRSNPSLSSLFASTASLSGSTPSSGSATPTASVVPGSVFSPPPRPNGAISPVRPGTETRFDELRALIARGFAPHVGVFASAETDEFIRHKGLPGGLLELIRPFGESIQGKLTIRTSIGSSQTFDDFGIRFVGLRDGLGMSARNSIERRPETPNGGLDKQRSPGLSWTRTGGDISQIEEVLERHLLYSEMTSDGALSDYLNLGHNHSEPSGAVSPFYSLYIKRMLSGLPLTPHETFAHPVACIIAISSHNPAPLEELRRLYDATNRGDYRFPQWVNNEFLRYYILVHDEDRDDIKKSTALFEQMKRHYGLNCHLLRIRSAQAVSSDDDSTRLPLCQWMSASEELYEIHRRETADYDEDPSPCIFESDATAIRIFVRELVAQSVVPMMERLCATWNEQILSRRKGISGRFMSLSKRWTAFGSSSRNTSSPIAGGSSSNYDSLQGFYRPDAPEALMRKLADYAFMLRDYKLAQSTYDLLRSDYNNDKAWKYSAGAHEMAAIAALMYQNSSMSAKTRAETVDQLLETASYSYLNRCAAPYNALRTLAIGIELLRMRGGSATDDAARWGTRVLEMRLVGNIGQALFYERVASCYAARTGVGSMNWGSRKRKAGFWAALAAEEWLALDKSTQAEKNLHMACRLYGILPDEVDERDELVEGQQEAIEWTNEIKAEPPPKRSLTLPFAGMQSFVEELRENVAARRQAALAAQGYDVSGDGLMDISDQLGESVVEEVVEEDLGAAGRNHRKSLSVLAAPGGVNFEEPLSPLMERKREILAENPEDDGFN